MDVEIEIPAIHIVLADQLRLVSLFDGLFERVALIDVFTAQIDIAFVSAHCAACHHATLDQQVRIMAHDLAVLAGTGLGFVSIDDEIVRAIPHFLRHEGPFQARGEASATPAAQA